MSLGTNLQYLRRQRKCTQEDLAARISVSRQTVSRWEADEVTPELDKLIELCELYSCKLDALVRENLSANDSVYSAVTIRRVPAFRMAKYVMITPNPEDDVNAYMDRWAQNSGLLSLQHNASRIGWDFPFISQEQKSRFGLRGYAAAYVLPENFETACSGVELAEQKEADYAVITVQEPFVAAFERIPRGYGIIMEYFDANGFRLKPEEGILPCFEREYDKNGVTCMDIFVHVSGSAKGTAYIGLA